MSSPWAPRPTRQRCGHDCTASAEARCCRCQVAAAWFLLDGTHQSVWLRPGSLPARLQRAPVSLQRGRRVEFATAWRNAGGELTRIDPTHPGWHAGLCRPSGMRLIPPDWPVTSGPPTHVFDRYGVTSGCGVWKGRVCDHCRIVAPQIPMWLFWHARGWSPAQARYLDALEQRTGVGQIEFPPRDRMPWSPTWTDAERHDARLTEGGSRRRAAVPTWRNLRAWIPHIRIGLP